eukprot:scaffold2984_cov452-Prasinococcus_capsulatus_cf.AAC.7
MFIRPGVGTSIITQSLYALNHFEVSDQGRPDLRSIFIHMLHIHSPRLLNSVKVLLTPDEITNACLSGAYLMCVHRRLANRLGLPANVSQGHHVLGSLGRVELQRIQGHPQPSTKQ